MAAALALGGGVTACGSLEAANGTGFYCARKTDGSIWCWGTNTKGQLGDGTTTNRSAPTRVGSANDWADIDVNHDHACARKTDGTLWCWGANTYGQLGAGTTTNRHLPTQVPVP